MCALGSAGQWAGPTVRVHPHAGRGAKRPGGRLCAVRDERPGLVGGCGCAEVGGSRCDRECVLRGDGGGEEWEGVG